MNVIKLQGREIRRPRGVAIDMSPRESTDVDLPVRPLRQQTPDGNVLGPSSRRARGRRHMSPALILLGFVIVIAGAAWGLSVAGMPTMWIAIASVILPGVGVVAAVRTARSRDLPT